MKSRGLLFSSAITLLVWGAGTFPAPGLVWGQQDEMRGRAGGDTAKKKAKEERTVRRALRMEEIEIYGDVEKPKTMFVIPRASLKYSRKDQEKDFTNEILGPITKEWVEDTQRWRADVPQP